MLVHQFLEHSADRFPTKTCLVCDNRRLTYLEVEVAANRLAHSLRMHGIARGDRVALFLPNCIELVVGIFGVLKAGAVFVNINPTAKQDKLKYILKNCQASALIAPSIHAQNFKNLPAEIASLKLIILTGQTQSTIHEDLFFHWDEFLANSKEQRPNLFQIDLDLACLIYTSGSTGDPKGVISDHSNVDFASSSIIQYLENTPDDIVINVLPLSFDYGLYQLLMVFKFGGTLILEKGFAYPASILNRIQAERVTGFPGVPTIYSLIVQMDLSSFDLSSLRYLTNTAAALPPEHIRRLKEKFPWARLFSMYGLTETKRTLYLPPEELDRRIDSVGIPIPGTETFLVDENGNRLGPGMVGELVVRGRHVMRGYWNDPETTARVFRPGNVPGERWCYTGDLFRMDDAGFFYFVARKDDIIKSRGEKVAPLEVEKVLYKLKGVREAAVIGTPDPILGQAVKAFLVIEPDSLTEREILAFCKANLEDFMVPKYIEIVSDLPKTSSGKIKKSDLR